MAISTPKNYKQYWMAQDDSWVSFSEFTIWFGDLLFLNPSHQKEYLFKNNNLLEDLKKVGDTLIDSPDLIRVWVDFDVMAQWIELVDFESMGPYWPGMETHEKGTYIGEIESATKLKRMIEDDYWVLFDESQSYSQGDDDDYDFPLDRWGRSNQDYDDFVHGAEGD
jgi:hypothetical protein